LWSDIALHKSPQEEAKMLDYAARLKKARARMAEENIGLMYLAPAADLFYLTGIRRQQNHPTDHNRYGDWIMGGYIGPDDSADLVAARMGGTYFEAEAEDKPWFDSVRLILESEDPLDVLQQVLSRFNLKGKKVALDNKSWTQTALAFRRLLPETEFILASDIITPMRMIKEEAEIELMRKAGQIADIAFRKAMDKLKPGVTELDIANEIDYQFRLAGAEYNSFITGVRFVGPERGREATAARSTAKKLEVEDSVTFDLGCVYEGYCSDFGRTAFVGEPPAEYVKIHDLVLEAQREGMKAMKAGQITAAKADKVARAVIEAEGYGPNFTHRLGHGIGVTVHEPPFLDGVDPTVLQANMTFTVEPSIRVPGRFGNRVEDVVLVTKEGGVSLYTTDWRLYIVE
jgi:Xaa-Pro aminopeptidase